MAAGVLFVLIVLILGIAPAGERTWAVFDMKMQYLDFCSYYKSVLEGKADLLYAPSMTLGSGAVGFFTYYLSSPLWLLLAFFKREYLPEAVTVLTGLRFMLIAFCADLFLQDHLRRERTGGENEPRTLLFSLAYTFCSYTVAYALNPMWMEVWALLPVCLMMLRRLLEEKKPMGYILSLAAMLWCNYYMAFMGCIFLVLWTAVLLLLKPEGAPRKFLRFASASLLGGALTAFALLPTFLELFGSPKDAAAGALTHASKSLSLLKIFRGARFLSFDAQQTWSGTPLLYCGALISLLALLFFVRRSISLKEKLGMGALLMILTASFGIEKFNLLWHAGMEPSGYPYRQAFLFVLVVIVCAARAWDAGHGGRSCGASSVRVRTYLPRQDSDNRTVPMACRRIIPVVCTVLQLAAILFNAVWVLRVQTSSGMLSRSDYRAAYAATAKAADAIDDTAFYRVEHMQPRQQNDGMMFGYNALTHYSSAGLLSTRNFLKRLGYNDDGLYTAYGQDNTCTADALLGIRYLIAAKDRDTYSLLYNGTCSLSKNPYALSVAALVDTKPSATASDPFSLQEELLSARVGETVKVFIPAYTEKHSDAAADVYECRIEAEGCVYLYLAGIEGLTQNLSIEKDGEFLSGYGNLGCLKVLNLGRYEKGEALTLRITGEEGEKTGELLMVTEDTEALAVLAEKAKKKDAVVTQLSSSHYSIRLDPALQGGLFTTIPYESSWRAFANGRRLKTEEACDAFLYIPEEELAAADAIELRYLPEGLVPGIVISALALAVIFTWGGFCGIIKKLFYTRKKSL